MLSLTLKKTILRFAIVIILLLLGAAAIEYLFRCYGEPLGRAEALQRATTRLQTFSRSFSTGDTPPVLVGERYEADIETWLFSFRSEVCFIDVIVDRCHGTEIGGTSGCSPK